MAKGGWRHRTDPRVLVQANIEVPKPLGEKKKRIKFKKPDPLTKLELLRKQLIHSQCLANQRARLERKKQAVEAYEKKHSAKLDESVKDEVARFKKAKADGLFNRLFFPKNGPCPF